VSQIRAPRTDAQIGDLIDPRSPLWEAAPSTTLEMAPTPLGYQPSVYVVAAWEKKTYGDLPELAVRALHNGRQIAIRLEWPEARPVIRPADLDAFADGAGVLFPLAGSDTPIDSMGSPERPVRAWYWRPDLEKPLSVDGKGAGSATRLPDNGLQAKGEWRDSRWSLVFARDLASRDGLSFVAPSTVHASFAVWRGANQERAGLKAFARIWHEIHLEA